ncbi:hypothetical protein ABTM83_19485, partial [Acinetobacter baumannii]
MSDVVPEVGIRPKPQRMPEGQFGNAIREEFWWRTVEAADNHGNNWEAALQGCLGFDPHEIGRIIYPALDAVVGARPRLTDYAEED